MEARGGMGSRSVGILPAKNAVGRKPQLLGSAARRSAPTARRPDNATTRLPDDPSPEEAPGTGGGEVRGGGEMEDGRANTPSAFRAGVVDVVAASSRRGPCGDSVANVQLLPMPNTQ